MNDDSIVSALYCFGEVPKVKPLHSPKMIVARPGFDARTKLELGGRRAVIPGPPPNTHRSSAPHFLLTTGLEGRHWGHEGPVVEENIGLKSLMLINILDCKPSTVLLLWQVLPHHGGSTGPPPLRPRVWGSS